MKKSVEIVNNRKRTSSTASNSDLNSTNNSLLNMISAGNHSKIKETIIKTVVPPIKKLKFFVFFLLNFLKFYFSFLENY